MDVLLPVNEGGRRIGETHHRARLSDGAVDQILALHDGGMSYGKIAVKFDCAKSTVRDVCTGRIRAQLSAHHFKRAAWIPAVAPALVLDVPDVQRGDDWKPSAAPTVDSLALPPITDEEPGQRAMRLIAWAVMKAPNANDLEAQAG